MGKIDQLQIYKASAGSGKTHTLVEKYLEMLLQKGYKDGYKRILVATFTNKATAELRERIVKELAKMVKKGNSRAREVLEEILLDYSSLRVQTIDSFFQEVVRSFVFELNNKGAGAELVLDSEGAIDMSVDQLLISLPKERIKGFEHLLEKDIEEGKRPDLQKAIYQLAIQMLYHPLAKQYDLSLISDDRVQEAIKELEQKEQESYLPMQKAYNQCKDLLERHKEILHLSSNSFLESIYNKGLDKLIEEKWNTPDKPCFHSRVNLDKKDYIVSQKNRKDPASQPLLDAQEDFKVALQNLEDALNANAKDYQLAQLLGKYLPYIPLLSDTQQAVTNYQREHKIILIEEINQLVEQVIEGSSVPFLYEKVGGQIDHYMIDEFQDTNATQWDNFKVLLQDGLSKGNGSYLVGDVKQSIYRFRGADSSLLNNKVQEDPELSPYVDVEPLQENWRSDEYIVQFNNKFFEGIYNFPLHASGKKTNSGNEEIYAKEVDQTPIKGKGEGYVQLEYLKKANEEEPSLKQRIQELLITLHERDGYSAGDIAFLVRRNGEAQTIANLLEELTLEDPEHRDCYAFISDYALRVDKARIVTLITSLFQLTADPTNESKQLYFQVACLALAPNDPNLWERLRDLPNAGYTMTQVVYQLLSLVDIPEEEELYLNAFMDLLYDFTQDQANTYQQFNTWWDKKGSKTLIPMGDNESNKIQIVTIHKAKGLAFPIVIMPFVQWEISKSRDKNGEIAFCSSSSLPQGFLQNPLPFYLIPNAINSKLLNSHLSQRYLELHENNYLDNLNLLYVSFTRARHRLYLYTDTDSKGVAPILFDRIDKIPEIKSEDNNRWYLGKETPKRVEEETDTSSTHITTKLHFPKPNQHNYLTKLQIDSTFDNAHTEHGKLMHDLMARAVTPADFRKAVLRLPLPPEEHQALTDHFLAVLEQSPILQYCFTPEEGKVILREESLYIPQEKKHLRPDRVVIKEGKAVILDFKFGQKKESFHLRQVRQYMQHYEAMGLATEGYLWYWQSEQPLVPVERK